MVQGQGNAARPSLSEALRLVWLDASWTVSPPLSCLRGLPFCILLLHGLPAFGVEGWPLGCLWTCHEDAV